MDLTIRDVARALKVEEKEIYRLVSHDDLPAEEVNGVYRFNRVQILEWATVQKRGITPDLFRMGNGNGGAAMCNLHDALQAGGIFHGIKGADKEAVLRAVVEAMPLPPHLNRDLLLEVFLSRESLGSTGIGDGIALPHPNYPVVLPLSKPCISLCFLAQPIPYSSTDRQPVHTLFAMICPTARVHLDLLARMAYALNDTGFREALLRKAPAAEILEQAARIEETLQASSSKTLAGAR